MRSRSRARSARSAKRSPRGANRSWGWSATRLVADDRRSGRPPRATSPRARRSSRDARAHARRRHGRASRRRTEYLQVVQNWGRQAGALTDHLCLDVYDVPHIPHRIGEELGGAARYVIREGVCPFCRLVRDEVAIAERLVHEDQCGVPSRRTRHGHRSSCGSCRATTTRTSGAPPMLSSLRRRDPAARARLAGRAGRPALQPGAPHGAAAGARRRDLSLALGDPPPAARDGRAGARHGVAGQPRLPEEAAASARMAAAPRSTAASSAGPAVWDELGERGGSARDVTQRSVRAVTQPGKRRCSGAAPCDRDGAVRRSRKERMLGARTATLGTSP